MTLIKMKDFIIVMAKKPEPGKVLTRLAKDVGINTACELYQCFLADLFQRLRKYSLPFMISCDSQDSVSYFRNFSPESIIVQKGSTLGERIFSTLQESFLKRIDKAVLIGSDSPDLPIGYLKKAFRELSFHDLVLGPSDDGGYYLIGCHKSSLDYRIFKDVSWSTKNVWHQTIKNIQTTAFSHSILNKWYDIDDKKDLKKFYSNSSNSYENYKTIRYIVNKSIFEA